MKRHALIATILFAALLATCTALLWRRDCQSQAMCGLTIADGGRALASAVLVAVSIVLGATLMRAARVLSRTAAAVADLPVSAWPAALADAAIRTGASRIVCLRDTELSAFTSGALRPRVYITDSLVRVLHQDELDGVLLHECAHVRRHDPLRHALRRAAHDVTFFLPVLEWWGHRQRNRAELVADRCALRSVTPRALAGALWVAGAHVEGVAGAGFGGAGARAAQLLGDRAPSSRPRPDEVVRSIAGTAVALAIVACAAPLIG